MKEFEFSGFGYPSNGGVYAFFAMTNNLELADILYIGSSKNVDKRIKSHGLRKIIPMDLFYCVGFIETENYIELEKALIKKYNPPYNKQHVKI